MIHDGVIKIMYIVNANNCWFTNVGEGFIDIGVQNFVANLTARDPSLRFGALSCMSDFYLGHMYAKRQEDVLHLAEARCRAAANSVKLENYFAPDLYILPGMFATREFACGGGYAAAQREMAITFRQRGGQIGFLGLGACEYTDEERRDFLKLLEVLQPAFVVTRDRKTYELYHNDIDCVQGLDCAFWVKDGFDPRGLRHARYVISTFNRSDEPEDLARHADYLRPWHMQYDLTVEKTRYLAKKNLMVSDSPFDYITLYANAEKVYTDLVHATIISLLYGTPVRYYPIDERKDAFASLPYLRRESNGFLQIDQEQLAAAKDTVENYVMEKIASL